MASLDSNPFATRFVSPGQIQWIGSGDYLEQLVSRWKALNCRASIVGVHGSGKSTLLEHFVPLIGDVIWRRDAEGNVVSRDISGIAPGIVSNKERPYAVWLQLRKTVSQSMRIPWEELTRGKLLILDGYEQLSRWRRVVLVAGTNLRGVKLLVTSHRGTLLPTLCELSLSAFTAQQIVSQLTTGRGDFATISDNEIRLALESHRGNMREVLMDLYDQHEARRELENTKVKSKS